MKAHAQGGVSAALAGLPANLTYLDLGNNALSGALGGTPRGPPSPGLQALYLGSNLLTGSLPACLFSSGAGLQALCRASVLPSGEPGACMRPGMTVQ